MTDCSSDWVKNLFAATARDWTPAPARRAVRVIFAPIADEAEAAKRCASVMSPGEQERAERFTSEDARTRFVQRRAFRRYCGAAALGSSRPLSRIAFAETEKGRPYLPDCPEVSFSFSACRLGFIGAWSTQYRIGVDIEDPTMHLEIAEIAQYYFSQSEITTIETSDVQARRRLFFLLWSLKEAGLKSIGEGLPFGLDAFQFQLDPEPHVVEAPQDHGGPERFDARLIGGTHDCAALVTRSAA